MAIQTATQRNAMSTYYATTATYLGLSTNAGTPGSGSTPANEASGGSYSRVATSWGSASDNGTTSSVVGSAVVISAAAATYPYSHLSSAVSGATMRDWGTFGTAIVLSLAGQIVVTATYSQT